MSVDEIAMSVFAVFPEDCTAKILSFTSPKDACRAAVISMGFKSAAESDMVWERFLPPDYRSLLSASTSPLTFSSKKELYFLLATTPLLIDAGKLSVVLSRSTGKKCYLLCARELQIAWIDNSMHWEWKSLPESRFAEVAVLLNVCWLDIRFILKAQLLSPNTTYVAYLVYKLSEGHYGLNCPSNASVKIVEEENGTEIEGETSTVYIYPPRLRRSRRGGRLLPPAVNGRVARIRTQDDWFEIELGEFFIGEGDNRRFMFEFGKHNILIGNAALSLKGSNCGLKKLLEIQLTMILSLWRMGKNKNNLLFCYLDV